MKKILITSIVSLILLTGSVAYAATSSLVGAKVQGIFSVMVNGEEISDAVVINGSTYVPVRSLTDSIDGKIKVEGKTVMITTEMKSVDIGADERTIILKGKIYRHEIDIKKLENKKSMLDMEIAQEEKIITDNEASPLYKDFGMVYHDTPNYKATVEKLADLNAQVEVINAEIADIESQIAVVEAELTL